MTFRNCLVHVGMAALVALTVGCSSEPEIPLLEAAQAAASGVGKASTIYIEGNRGPIFVFEENHASKSGQVQIATMLLRLKEKYQVRVIGLEGAIQAEKPL